MKRYFPINIKVWFIVTLVLLWPMLIAQVVFAFTATRESRRLISVNREVAVDKAGNIYVFGGGDIQELDAQAHFVAEWGTRGSGDGQFAGRVNTNSIAVDSNNNIYLADGGNYRIQKFDSQGHFLAKWGSQGTEDGQFGLSGLGPCGLALDKQNNVYVFDCWNYRVEKFDSQGHFLAKWGSQGSGDGQFSPPYLSIFGGIAVDGQGNVYVADAGNKRIEKFDSQGRFLLKWGGFGTGPGQFGTAEEIGPLGLATDDQLNVYATNGGRQIQKFDSKGNFLTQWSIIDAAAWPSDDKVYDNSDSIAIDKHNIIYTVSGIFDENNDPIRGTNYIDVHLQTFNSKGQLLKRWSDPFYLPWWFVWTAPPVIGLLAGFWYARRRGRR